MEESINEQFRDAMRLQQDGDLDRARKLLTGILDALPNHPEVLFRLGILEQRASNLEASLGYLARACKGKSEDENYALMYGSVLTEAGHLEEAVPLFERYAHGEGKGARYAGFNLVTIYTQLGQMDKAKVMLRGCMDRFPVDEAFQSLHKTMNP